MKNIFNIHISLYIFALILVISGYINYLIIYLLIMTFHEIGHIITIKILGYKINNITLFPGGGIINTNIKLNINSFHLFLISISGILMQLLLFILIKNNGTNNYHVFCSLNKSIIIFNLLPIIPLDGSKIYMSIMESKIYYYLSSKIQLLISIISIFILFIYSKNILVFIYLYIFNISYYYNFKFNYNKFLLERYLYKKKYKHNKYINKEKHIYKNYNNYIKGIHEYDVYKSKISKNIF